MEVEIIQVDFRGKQTNIFYMTPLPLLNNLLFFILEISIVFPLLVEREIPFYSSRLCLAEKCAIFLNESLTDICCLQKNWTKNVRMGINKLMEKLLRT